MLWTASAVVSATAGRRLDRSGVAPEPFASEPVAPELFASVSFDSRDSAPGALFVPIVAARDGHEFVADAVANGAAGYLVQRGHRLLAARPDGIAIEVADTGAALLDIGRAARARLPDHVIGITGSVGKTSTKDLLAAALAGRWIVTASPKSLNNELGVPLTLANATEGTEITVVEMGARGRGHISQLCDVARPTMAIVTAVLAVHTALFGTIDAVAEAKAELVEALPAGGTAVLNGDDGRVAAMATRTDATVLTYSASGRAGADIVASDIRLGADLRPTFSLASPWGGGEVTLGVRGAHQVGNALAAAAMALRCEVDVADVLAALASASLSPWRMELLDTPSGAVVVNDAYNANPVSMAAALRSLVALPARRRVAVVGEMAELGATSAAEHRAIAVLAAELGVELVAVDTEDYGMVPVVGIEGAARALGPLGDGDAVLVKASRVVGLERLVPLLTARPTPGR